MHIYTYTVCVYVHIYIYIYIHPQSSPHQAGGEKIETYLPQAAGEPGNRLWDPEAWKMMRVDVASFMVFHQIWPWKFHHF